MPLWLGAEASKKQHIFFLFNVPMLQFWTCFISNFFSCSHPIQNLRRSHCNCIHQILYLYFPIPNVKWRHDNWVGAVCRRLYSEFRNRGIKKGGPLLCVVQKFIRLPFTIVIIIWTKESLLQNLSSVYDFRIGEKLDCICILCHVCCILYLVVAEVKFSKLVGKW